ncbi:I78 family peptidase inhibitor [Brevundimonas sp.]|uniref:I78 family peptidase inhibitor n=1 Tax=Brevundimonas sp. TaxID=1871086 RepID=UPI003A93A5B2
MSRFALAAILSGIVVMAAACAPVPVTETPAPGRCDAAASQSLIGRHVGAVTFPRDANVRLVCTTCAATMDHDPDRLNIRFDEATGIIRAVDCG